MDAAYSHSIHMKMWRTHHVQTGTKKPLETLPILFWWSLNIVLPILSIELLKRQKQEKWDKHSLLTNFLQFIKIAAKLIVHHCYRKTNYCVYCLDEFWFSDGSLSDKAKFNDPGLMPLPDTATGLDWSHLVDAARAFEGNRKIWIKVNVRCTNFFFFLMYSHVLNYKNSVSASVAFEFFWQYFYSVWNIVTENLGYSWYFQYLS